MKRLIPTICLILCCTWLVSCQNSANKTNPTTSSNTISTPAANITSPNSSSNTAAQPPTNNTNIVEESPANNPSPDVSTNIEESPASTTTDPAAAPDTEAATNQPKTGTIKELVNGDLKCYVTLVDDAGQEHNLGATFEVCEQQTLLNQKVTLTYSIENVSDCESAEPCGKSREESLISKMQVIKE